MSNARVSPLSKKVHAILPAMIPGEPPAAVCGQLPLSGVRGMDPDEVARWRWTQESVDCQTCLDLTGKQTNVNFVWRRKQKVSV